jgi:hypothetical protein
VFLSMVDSHGIKVWLQSVNTEKEEGPPKADIFFLVRLLRALSGKLTYLHIPKALWALCDRYTTHLSLLRGVKKGCAEGREDKHALCLSATWMMHLQKKKKALAQDA